MLSIGLTLFAHLAEGLPALPPGFLFLTDADGAYVVDWDGALLVEAI